MSEKDVTANNKTPVIIVPLITAVCGLGDAMLFIVLPIYFYDLWTRSLLADRGPIICLYYFKGLKKCSILFSYLFTNYTTLKPYGLYLLVK
ncbi:hypothetical protein DLJ74_00950 [Gracilibacillus dipsosauri]|uniref:Uncharacterized protein n=1 Tax=Gracilibacillus dipsosauri TaxID=178340 RepID=A0A317L3H5_9BACI|nr:hypothetical protein DLJ74_00950 [Gracilibacillus dipsosauri]